MIAFMNQPHGRLGTIKPHVAALRWPHVTLLAWSALILIAGYGLQGLRLRTDGFALIPQGAPEVQYDAVARKIFGLRDRIIVVLESKLAAGIFQENALRCVAQLTAELRKLPGVDPDDVISLATETSGRLQVGPVQFPALLDPLPQTEGEIEQARGDATALRIYAGTLLSREKEEAGRAWAYRATAVLVGIPTSADRKDLYQEIRRIAIRAASHEYNIHVVGGPVAESLLGDYVLDDLRKLVPATILVMSVIFCWLFRSGRFVVVVLAEIGACLMVTFGAIGLADVPVTIAMAVLPMVVIPVIVADEVHIFTALCRFPAGGVSDRIPQLREAFDGCWVPVAKTGVTTALSGMVFAISPVGAIRDFGIFLSVASLSCMLWTLTATPALMAVMYGNKSAWGQHPRFETPQALIWWVTRRPGTVIAIIVGVPLLPIALGLTNLTIQDSWTSGFGKATVFRRSMEKVDSMFDGTQLLYLIFDTRPGAVGKTSNLSALSGTGERILKPEMLATLGRFENFVETAVGADRGGILGAYEQIATARFMLSGRVDSDRRHGNSVQENSELLHLLEAIIGERRLREMIDAANQQAVITVFLKDANYRAVDALLKKIAEYERAYLSPRGIRVGYAGDVLLSQSLIKAITYTELWSIGGSLGAMCLLIALMERSIWIGIICSFPSLLAILANLSLMGMLGIPIGVATSMFAGITFGIGVDSSIHFFERIRLSKTFDSQATTEALSHVYVAVLVESIVLVCGFSVLMASSVPVNRALGIFLASSFVSCSFVTVCLLPAICCCWSERRDRHCSHTARWTSSRFSNSA